MQFREILMAAACQGGGASDSGGDVTPLAKWGFKDGDHSISGVSKTLAQVAEQNDAWYEDFDPLTDVVAGVGLIANGPVATSALKSLLLAGGCTAVVQFTGPTDGVADFEVVDLPNYESDFYLNGYIGHAEYRFALYPGNFVATEDDGLLAPDTVHKIALTITPDSRMAGSANGNPVVVASSAVAWAPTDVAVAAILGAVIEFVTFYAPVADADLPALSAP